MVDFWWQIFCQFSPGKIGLHFVSKNFTTFFTARKVVCHLEFTLGASSPNMSFVCHWRKRRLTTEISLFSRRAFLMGLQRGGVRNRNLFAFVRVCSRLHVQILLTFSPLDLLAYVNVCLHLFAFARSCLHPPLSPPPPPLRASEFPESFRSISVFKQGTLLPTNTTQSIQKINSR